MLLKLENITKGFGDRSLDSYRVVLDQLNMEMESGERVAILGPSGTGKTTLLNLIGGLDYPDEGSVKFRGEEITGYSPGEMDRFRNRSIGYVFQFHHLLPQCTLMENILVPTLPDREKSVARNKRERAEELMNRVGIWNLRDKLPGRLSGGECQRAAVVRAMINSPSLLLADEPTGALDRTNVERMAELLAELSSSEGIALLVVTHSLELAERMGKTYELKAGKLT